MSEAELCLDAGGPSVRQEHIEHLNVGDVYDICPPLFQKAGSSARFHSRGFGFTGCDRRLQ